MASLLSLPDELLDIIAKHIDRPADLVQLLTVNRRFSDIATIVLYKRAVVVDGGFAAIDHGLKLRSLRIIEMCLVAGANPDQRITSTQNMERHYHQESTLDLQLVSQGTRADLFPGLTRQLGHETARTSAARGQAGTANDDPSSFLPTYTYVRAEYHPEDDYLHQHPFAHIDFLPIEDHQSMAYRLRKPEHEGFWTPLHVAAARGDMELLELLLKHGADPVSAGNGLCGCGDLPRMFHHSQNIPPDEIPTTILAWSPLHVSVCRKQYACAQRLIEGGGGAHLPLGAVKTYDDPDGGPEDDSDSDSDTAHSDAGSEDEPVPAMVLDPSSLFHVAAYYDERPDRADRVYNMLEHANLLGAAGVNVHDHDGNNAFAVAAFSGHLRGLGAWLVSKGADVNALVHNEAIFSTDRLMFFLCGYGKYEQASLAMDLGADTHNPPERPHQGTLLHWCCSSTLRAPRSKPTAWKTERDADTLVKKLLASGLDVDSITGRMHGHTPLMVAARKGSLLIARTLLLANAQVNAVDEHGCTVLHQICEAVDMQWTYDHQPYSRINFPGFAPATASMVRLLLEFGADVNQRRPDGRAPLHLLFGGSPYLIHDRYAIRTVWHARDVVVGVLLGFGADMNACDNNGESVIVYTYQQGDFRGVELLLASGLEVSRSDYWRMLQHLEASESFLSINAVNCLFTLPRKQPTNLLTSPAFQKLVLPAWDRVFQNAARACAYDVLDALLDHGIYGITGGVEDNVLRIAARFFKRVPAQNGGTQQAFEFMVQVVTRIARGPPEHTAHPLIDQPGAYSLTPLIESIRCGNLDVTSVLVQCGAAVNSKDVISSMSTNIIIFFAPIVPYNSLMNTAQEMLKRDNSPQDVNLSKGYLIELVLLLEMGLWTYGITHPYLPVENGLWQPSFSAQKIVMLALLLLDHVDINHVSPDGHTALSLLLDLVTRNAEPRWKDYQPHNEPSATEVEALLAERIQAMLNLFMLLVSNGADLYSKNNPLGGSLSSLLKVFDMVLPSPELVSSYTWSQRTVLAFRRYVRVWPFTSSLSRSVQSRYEYTPQILVFNDMRFPLSLVSEEELNDPSRWVGIGKIS